MFALQYMYKKADKRTYEKVLLKVKNARQICSGISKC